MNITRRDFLKIIGATAVAAAVPLPAQTEGLTDILDEALLSDLAPGSEFGIYQELPPGEYLVSYSFRVSDSEPWRRHMQTVEVDEPMTLRVAVAMGSGNSISRLQVEEKPSFDDRGFERQRNNLIGTRKGAGYFLTGSFTSPVDNVLEEAKAL